MLRISPETHLPATHVASGITLRDVVFVLYRRRWVVLSIFLPIVLIGSLGLFKQTGAYTASSRVVVELVKVDLPRWNAGSRNIDYDRELSTLFNIAMSVPVARKAAALLEDSIPRIKILDLSLTDLDQPEQLRAYLLGGLDVGVVGESSILEFRFTSTHPQISLMASGALRDAFVDFQVYGRRDPRAIAYYTEQVNTIRAETDSLLQIRSQVLSAAGYSSMKDELRYDSGQLANIKSDLFDAIVARRTAEMEYGRLTAYLEGDPRDFPMGPDENRSMTLVHWRNTLAIHENELNSILTIHTENSVAATRKRSLIEHSLENLANEERNYVASFKVTLDVLHEKERALRDLIVEIEADNSKAPEVYRTVSLLDTELNSLRKLMDDMQGKRGEVRLSQLADDRVSSVVVLTDPELTHVISGGKTIVYFGFIVIFALALGVVVAFLLEGLDHRVYGPRDVEEHLKLPVFASVTKVD